MAKFAIYGDADSTSAFNPRTARAFCAGRKANADGVLIGDNPFALNIERENNLAWEAGHASYTTSATARECCAV